jgi:RNA polymerase sigma-70 factor, ECF subfamily
MNHRPHDEWTGKIIAWINRELDAKERALFETHMQSCPQCTQELKEYEMLLRRLHALERDMPVPVLSPALLALKQEIAQVARQRLLDEAQQVLEQALTKEKGDNPYREDAPSTEQIVSVVKKAQAGDEASFNTLYQLYYAQIFRYLLRMSGNHEEASDLAVETFLKAWRGLSGLNDVLRFRNWLFSIALHTALDFQRQRRAIVSSSWERLGEGHLDENATTFISRLEEKELVELALQQVAPKLRACLLLQIEGFSQAEIAGQVGLHEKSVDTYVNKARKQFRQAYSRLKGSADM